MHLFTISAVSCFAIAMALLDRRNKKLQQENTRLRNEITKNYRYCSRFEEL